jgi:alcohol dehydrogenase class IV
LHRCPQCAGRPLDDLPHAAQGLFKKINCDVVIGFGGIESINCAKAISILINNYMFSYELFDYPVIKPPVSLVTVPCYPIFGFEMLPIFYLTDITDMIKKI